MRYTLISTTLILVVAFAFSACQKNVAENNALSLPQSLPSVSPTLDLSPTPEPNSDSPIRKIDFRNFTYTWTKTFGDVGKTFTLADGEKKLEDDRLLTLKSVVYGDLVERGEAIITIWVEDDNATSEMLFVYKMEGDKSKMIQSFEFSEDTHLATAFVAHGELVITTYNQLSGDSECCPSIVEISHYRWQKDKFVIQSESQKIPNDYVTRVKGKR